MDAQKYGYLTVGDTYVCVETVKLPLPPVCREPRSHVLYFMHWSGLPKISLHKMHTHVYISFSRESDYSISPMITLSAFSYKNALRIKHREKLEHFSLINSPHRWNFPSATIQRGVLEPAVLKAQYSDLFFRLYADIN